MNDSHMWRVRVAREFEAPVNDVITGLRDDGYSIYASAHILGISPHTLKDHCTRVGIDFERYAQSPDRKRHERHKTPKRHRMIEYNGESMMLIDWSRRTGIPRETIAYRIDRCGWSVARALTVKVWKERA